MDEPLNEDKAPEGGKNSGIHIKDMVGRTEELADLWDALQGVITERKPRMVTILGNAGIGKTRILTEFLSRAREQGEGIKILRGICQPAGRPYSVFTRILRTRFGLIEGLPSDKVQDQFRRELSEVLGDRRVTEFLHFLGSYVDVKFPDNPFLRTVEANPEQFDQIRKTVLKRFFEVDSENRPLIMTFEDLQFAAEETLELVRFLGENLENCPVLVLNLTTSEIFLKKPDWFDAPPGHKRIDVGPLSRINSERMLMHLLSQFEDLPDELVNVVTNLSGGNPMFLEQIVQILRDNKTIELDDKGKWGLHLDRLKNLRLPLSVEEAVQVRIGALMPYERSLLEKALCMGGVFWLGGLVMLDRIERPVPEIWGGSDEQYNIIREYLDGLEARDYIMKIPDSTFVGEEEYAFKHNLERQMIRRMANPAVMKKYHAFLAEWLEFKLDEKGEEHLELLATHLREGGNAQKAGLYFFSSGNLARQRYAHKRAITLYESALGCLGEFDAVLRIELHHNLGDVYQASGNFDKAVENFEKMKAMAYRLNSMSKSGAAHNRIGRVHRESGRLDEALRYLGTGLALFQHAGDERGVSSSLDDIGKVHWLKGSYVLAHNQMMEALEIRQRLGDLRSIALSYNNIGLVKQDSGNYEEALNYFTESLRLRREVGDITGTIVSLNNLGTVYEDKGEHEKAINVWSEGLDEAKRIDDRLRQTYLLTNIGVAQYQMARYDDAIKTLTQANTFARELGDRLLIGETERAIGKTYMLMGEHQKAREHLKEAIDTFERLRSKVQVAIALRTLAEETSEGGWGEEDDRKAEDIYKRSMMILEEVGNELELARTLRSFGRVLVKQGRVQEGEKMALRAKAIFAKLKVSTESLVHHETSRISHFEVDQEYSPAPDENKEQ
jgi:tetratricopeptide (TPR) repeat protein